MRVTTCYMEDIQIYVRDESGRRYCLVYANAEEAYQHLSSDDNAFEACEVLVVTAAVDPNTRLCLYTSLGTGHTLTVEELVGFFA